MTSSIDTVVDLLTRVDFIRGFAAGLILLVLFLLSRRDLPGWGLAVASATLIGVNLTLGRRLALTLGVGLMAAGGWVLDRRRGSTESSDISYRHIDAWGTVVIGAVLVSWRSGLPEQTWIPYVAPMVAIAAGQLLRFWRERPVPYLGALFLMTAIGIWSTVPETGIARILLGAAIPLAIATARGAGGRMTSAGAFALGGIVVWTAAIGGVTRHASIVGAWACLGALALFPMVFRWIKGLDSVHPFIIFAAHGLLVFISGRIIGLWQTALPAVAAVTVTYVVAASLILIPVRPGVSRSG